MLQKDWSEPMTMFCCNGHHTELRVAAECLYRVQGGGADLTSAPTTVFCWMYFLQVKLLQY